MLTPHGPPGNAAARRVLMIAFHFPPLAGSSGIQRTLRFVQHLPAHGWQPLVLTAHPRAYEATSADLLGSIPPDTVVERAFALDTARHLAVAGRYPGFLARPDRWRSWALGAVPAGLAMIRRHRPDVIWSTYPIASGRVRPKPSWLCRFENFPPRRLIGIGRAPNCREPSPPTCARSHGCC